MATILDAKVISLGKDVDDVEVKIDYDFEENLYDNGETTTTFYTDELIYLLAQPEPGYKIASIKTTSGTATNKNKVKRTIVVEDQFFPDTEKQTLSWYPSSSLIVENDHMQAGTQTLTVDGVDITCNNPPSVVDYSYEFEAYSVTVKHPTGLSLADDETFPIGLIVEVTPE